MLEADNHDNVEKVEKAEKCDDIPKHIIMSSGLNPTSLLRNSFSVPINYPIQKDRIDAMVSAVSTTKSSRGGSRITGESILSPPSLCDSARLSLPHSKQLICANSISQQGESIFPSPSVTPIPFTLSDITNDIESQAQISTTNVHGPAGKGTSLLSSKIPLPGSHLAPPPKQTATLNTGATTVEELIRSLNDSICDYSNRICSLRNVCHQLNHFHMDRHRKELMASVAGVLFQRLAFVYTLSFIKEEEKEENESVVEKGNNYRNATTSQRKINGCKNKTENSRNDIITYELALLCQALEMVHRTNEKSVRASFTQIGKSMLPLLVKVLKKSLQKSMEILKVRRKYNTNNTSESTVLPSLSFVSAGGASGVKNALSSSLPCKICSCHHSSQEDQNMLATVSHITKLFASYAHASTGLEKIVICNTKGLLSILTNLCIISTTNNKHDRYPKHHSDGSDVTQPLSIIISDICADALLVISELSREILTLHTILHRPHLLETIILLSQTDSNSRVRENASNAIFHFVNAPPKSISPTEKKYLIKTLHSSLDDVCSAVRRYAGASLFQMAYNNESNDVTLMLTHEDGTLLSTLVVLLQNDPNSKSRANAVWILFYCACSEKKSNVELLGDQNGLLDALAGAICDDTCAEVRTAAAKALRKISETINPNMKSHEALLSSLLKASARWNDIGHDYYEEESGNSMESYDDSIGFGCFLSESSKQKQQGLNKQLCPEDRSRTSTDNKTSFHATSFGEEFSQFLPRVMKSGHSVTISQSSCDSSRKPVTEELEKNAVNNQIPKEVQDNEV